jgi:Zn-dependent protease with chaperone function
MLVSRYNEAKADRRAARTLSTIGWAVIAIIVVIVVIAWVASRQ